MEVIGEYSYIVRVLRTVCAEVADELDRFAFMWQYLGLPFQDVAIVEKAKM